MPPHGISHFKFVGKNCVGKKNSEQPWVVTPSDEEDKSDLNLAQLSCSPSPAYTSFTLKALGRLKKVLWRQSKSLTEVENAGCRKIGAPNTGLFPQHISDTMSTVLSIWGESPSFKEAGFSPEAGGEFDIVFTRTIESSKKVFALVLGYFRSLLNPSANWRNDRTLNLKQFAAVVMSASRLWTEQTLLSWITSLKSNPTPLAQVMSDCACWVTASTVSVLYSIYAEATDPQYALLCLPLNPLSFSIGRNPE